MRAAANGRSMEAEARDILLDALTDGNRVDLTWIDMLVSAAEKYGGPEGVDLRIPEDQPIEVPDLTHLLGKSEQ